MTTDAASGSSPAWCSALRWEGRCTECLDRGELVKMANAFDR